jgi:CubicO group peptidase (beta-lactamase class C family)
MTQEVFQPLGMTDSLFDPDSSVRGGAAVMYDGRGENVYFDRSDAPGAGHGYSNVHDLIRFGMFHLKDHMKGQLPILDDRTIDRMQMEKCGAVLPGGGKASYGLGWFFDEAACGFRTVWHEGGWTGASAMLKLIPSEDLAVAVLMNVYDREFVNEVTDETIRALLPTYGNQKGGAADHVEGGSPPRFDLPIGRYAGEIRTSSGAIPLILDSTDGGELNAYLGDPASAPRRVQDAPEAVPRLPAQILASFPGPIGDQDATRHDHNVWLDLRFANDELYGTASAMTLGGHGWKGIDDQRMRFHLSYRVSLKRTNR